ncbi:MAG TPA: cytidylate kinase-like family protein [Acidimicrobiales bacterium]
MGCVALSASYGARGDQVGRSAAARLGLPFLDRAIRATVASQLHLSDESADSLDERAPGRWQRYFSSTAGLSMSPIFDEMGPIVSPETFRSATETVLREVADTTGAVILGRAAKVVLAGRDDVLCVRLDGPAESRVAQAVADGRDEATARKDQKDVDSARDYYLRYFYSAHQEDVRLYHLMIDSTALPVDVCVDLVVQAARARFGAAVS